MSLLLCSAMVVVQLTLAVPEKWADPRLPVREGLELWLDATRVAGAEKSVEGRVTRWSDASGKQRHLTQQKSSAQPVLINAGGASIVRFDGFETHLRSINQNAAIGSFSLFAVVAPRQNLGGFQGIIAFNAPDQRDYLSGLNLDLGPFGSPRFTNLNVEGKGFAGAVNLRNNDEPFGKLRIIELSSGIDSRAIKLSIDGKSEGTRPRDGQSIALNEITLGARYYNNEPGPQRVQGFGRLDLAEVLVYDRALSPDQSKAVRDYLDTKYAGLKESLPPFAGEGTEILQPVENPPPVQMFLPGFDVRELPIDLSNINNVKYRVDGTLVAMGYDGKVWLLRDTNGDGIEDRADLFWDNKIGLRSTIGMDLTPPGYQKGEGVFIVGKTHCLLVVDTDHDGKADKEIEVAGGWKESFHSVDGLGVAYDPKDGSVYFGRGTYNFTDPLLMDKNGKSHYSLTDESSSIIRVSPDFKTREIVATGIRFPVGLRFNRQGDLFATDQEGATWVPNGNPFDELLHIQKGRHYGFPARHPQFLPNVIDEPSTFDYTPQHQSTCGLNFNEPTRPGGAIFGPSFWEDDAIVTGYSRGKLYRTKLVITPAGYVARTDLFACLNMLTVDACVAPDGSLVVACHSGGPDWGSGPTGKGKLYKISYADRQHPQPVLIWPASEREIRVEFDREVDPLLLKDLLRQTKLTGGNYVGAGDRFESLMPGYAVVQMQKASPRFDVPIRSAQLTPDRRTLVLATDFAPLAVSYAISLPGMGRPSVENRSRGTLPQEPQVDLAYDLTGCQAEWTPVDGSARWTGWLPHLDLNVARALTRGSATHDALWASMTRPGELVLRARLDLVDMLRPAVQPGSRLDYEFPKEVVTLTFESSSLPRLKAEPSDLGGGSRNGQIVSANFGASGKTPLIEVKLSSKGGDLPGLRVSWTTNEDQRPRPVPLRRIILLWADRTGKAPDATSVAARPAELNGGSWSRGRKEFSSEQAGCIKCHVIHGQGGEIGPDLSNLIHRDYPSVVRDITNPSFAINPDHLTYAINLKDGRTLTGVVRTVGGRVRIGDTRGNLTEINRDEIEEMRPSKLSTMPEGLPKLLGPDRMRDLLTFLLTPPPSMPRDGQGIRPKPRTVSEVNAALAGAPQPPEKTRHIQVVLVAGPKDHGPGEHDYPAWQKAWSELLSAGDKIDVTTAWEWPSAEQFARADTLIFFQHGSWDSKRAADVDAYLKRGGGLVFIHWAIDGGKNGLDFARRIGLAGLGVVGFRHGELTLAANRMSRHPVMRNIDRLALTDETYWKMAGTLAEDRVLATAIEDGAPQPQVWSLEHGKGRVFVSIPGHYSWTFDDPLFRLLLLRGIAWSAHEPVDRFNDLIWPGANVTR